jgi:hypothetical protein
LIRVSFEERRERMTVKVAKFTRDGEEDTTPVYRCKECPHVNISQMYGWRCGLTDKLVPINHVADHCTLPDYDEGGEPS